MKMKEFGPGASLAPPSDPPMDLSHLKCPSDLLIKIATQFDHYIFDAGWLEKIIWFIVFKRDQFQPVKDSSHV